MLPFLPFPETQATLALSIVLFSFAYEDGRHPAGGSACHGWPDRCAAGFVQRFLGIWIGDIGLYWLGSAFGPRLLRSRLPFLTPEKLEKAETWFAGRGPTTLVMSRFIPDSRLPLCLAAGTLRFSARSFALITGTCSALWVTAILVTGRFVPRPAFGSAAAAPWLLAVGVLFGRWLLRRGAVRIWR